ncbi:Papain inhibitor [Lachnellula willkommii]|uniref:Papain inhibitor n=1 Tax=Lachnellula willkommii TaxID=215461 RepID=A0A559MLL5_9HELO|nr:Papain inhibitor [Lachnellula willkommii]
MAAATPIANPTREPLEWETPSTSKKPGIFSKYNIFNTSSQPQPQVQPAVTKEEDPAAERNARSSNRFTPHWTSRKTCFYTLAALLILVLILALGLGLGLGIHNGKKHKNLPLPTNTATFTGDLTYYSPGPGYGACGYENTSKDSICAVSHIVWDAESTSSNPNANPLCGKKIRIDRYNAAKGRNSSADVMVVDRCTGCQADDLDLSLSVFTDLAEESQGRVVGSWAWLS